MKKSWNFSLIRVADGQSKLIKGVGVVIWYLSIPPHNNSRVVVRNLRILVYRSSLRLTITHLKVNLVTVVCVYKDTLYKDNMAEIWPKPTLWDFGRPSIRTIWQKIQKGLFFKNSPLFRKNMGEEQKKKKVFIFFGKNYGFQNNSIKIWNGE